MIDLRSDTVTRPSEEMRKAIYSAEVGDDVFGEDPCVNRLEESLADMMGKEAALFCASGTMANQIAIKAHTSPGDQVISSWAAHIYNYEGGGMASNSGVTAKLLPGDYGFFTSEDVRSAISADDIHYPITRLVAIEDTSNKGGGTCWPIADIAAISKLCKEENLGLHLDGARLFNRLVAKGDKPRDYAKHFDTLSICLSKGLGAPVGSLLLGSREFIHKSRRIRKSFGGGMRQAGIIAAAGLYALDHNIDRLHEDHKHADTIAQSLRELKSVATVSPVETNIILFDVQEGSTAAEYIDLLQKEEILAFAISPQSIRLVLHMDISSKDVGKIITACQRLDSALTG